MAPEGTTRYFDAFGVNAELFSSSTISQWNEYLSIGRSMVGVRFERSDQTVATRYFHTDHLGSVAVITNEAAAVVERSAYDAWGKRRFPNGTDDPSGSKKLSIAALSQTLPERERLHATPCSGASPAPFVAGNRALSPPA